MASSSSGNSSLEEVLKKLRAVQPTPVSLTVELADGTVRELAVPTRRRKWPAVREMLDSLAWVSLDAKNAKGQTLVVIANDEAAEELEELELIPDRVTGQVTQLLSLMLRAQDVALKRQESHTSQLNSTVLKLAEVLMSRLVSLENSYARNLRLVEEFAKSAGGEDAEQLMSGPAVEALIPLLLSKFVAPPTSTAAPSPTPNTKK